MSLPLIIGAFWVLASAVVAMLPMRRQFIPGVVLLLAAPLLIFWIGYTHGWVWSALAIFAFVSMFRNPLIYLAKRALGLHPKVPE
jgi:hypothetical protein